MVAKPPVIDADMVEREIIAGLRAAKLRLRFDKVALRVVGQLKATLASDVPEGQAFLYTITAPIRLPGKTAAALESMVRASPPGAQSKEIVHDNEVRTRRVEGVSEHMPKVLGFVHNVGSDSDAILAIAEARLLDTKANG